MTTLIKGHPSLAFTGERVVPDAVEPQLWNEHLSRYRFACLFAKGARVLDVGCGTGYGTDHLARSGNDALGLDISVEAIRYAAKHFEKAHYVLGSASAIPLKTRSFGLITAFEVIEHLDEWQKCLSECARLLTHDGVFLVSTPNTEYYAEARGLSGPNPYHVHEFALGEFEESLKQVFPCVKVLAQNQQEAITFSGDWSEAESFTLIPPTSDVSDAHFFIGVCSFGPLDVPYYADVSSTRNLLRERERHIRGLQDELTAAQSRYSSWAQFRHSTSNGDRHAIETEQAPVRERDHEINTLRKELESLQREHQLVKASAWLQLGRVLGVGPSSDYGQRFRVVRGRIREKLNLIRQRMSEKLKPICRTSLGTLLYLRSAVWFLGSIALIATAAIGMAAVDICFSIFGKRRLEVEQACCCQRVSVIIPTWNGLDLLQANLPSLIKATSLLAGSEVVVVDNGSTDGSSEFLRAHFPKIRVLQRATNEGFAAACNIGATAAHNDIIVFLNNDMKVDQAFLTSLVPHFSDPLAFAVSSQIFFADPERLREETGLTETYWERGRLRVGHRIDPLINVAFPCSYPGGGSSAFNRAKFLQLGGFSHLFHPFYYEDTDLGYLAWKRGWKVLYEPASIVYHKHRGTIGKNYQPSFIHSIARRNSILFCWKNIHNWRCLVNHLGACIADSLPEQPGALRTQATPFVEDLFRAYSRLMEALKSRWQAHSTRQVSDKEAMLRPLGGYYRDRFLSGSPSTEGRLNVLFVSPYAIEPPLHGGAVFMRDAIKALQRLANVHVVSFVSTEDQLNSQQALSPYCSSAHFMVRPHFEISERWTLLPTAIREFRVREFLWAIHRTMLVREIDVLQVEYTTMGQYAEDYCRIPCMLFEHDISAQSLWRRIKAGDRRIDVMLEYIRMRIYEPRLLERLTRVQVCSRDNAQYVKDLRIGLKDRVDFDLRANIDVHSYSYSLDGRLSDSLLFIGGFNHIPNVDGLKWFIRDVLPAVLRKKPNVLLYVVGSSSPEQTPAWLVHPNVKLVGCVHDIRQSLQKYLVFVCPILVGSGVRVKLLEAFASGIPAVATSVGAEGLASKEDLVCELADSPLEFAHATLGLLEDQGRRIMFARNARQYVERSKDSRKAAIRLETVYRDEVQRVRGLLRRSA